MLGLLIAVISILALAPFRKTSGRVRVFARCGKGARQGHRAGQRDKIESVLGG
ncbi:hypothetical protein [Paraburkholderia flagellata]|uniref:hypothetical protein n=1 Tax=Paraburkholderia flagellata TaxID=2883241 RepID=UPI001F45C063|nr:hypothetical protein [Paraburkholderia flagellata]